MADVSQLTRLINTLNEANIEDKINREAIQTTHVSVVNRIFGRGEDASGQSLGQYTEGYYKRRKKKTRRTNRDVNLQFTGQMKNDFTPLKILGNNQYGAGFNNPENAKKSRYIEENYRTSIFELSTDEQKELEENFEFVTRKRLG